MLCFTSWSFLFVNVLRAPEFCEPSKFLNVVIAELLCSSEYRINFFIALGANILLRKKIKNRFSEEASKSIQVLDCRLVGSGFPARHSIGGNPNGFRKCVLGHAGTAA